MHSSAWVGSVASDTALRSRGLAPLIDFGRTIDARAADEGLPLIGLPLPGTLVGTAKWLTTRRFGVDWDATGHLDQSDQLADIFEIVHFRRLGMHTKLLFDGDDKADMCQTVPVLHVMRGKCRSNSYAFLLKYLLEYRFQAAVYVSTQNQFSLV